MTSLGFDTFMTKCKDAFDIRVPIKHKYLKSNESTFMKKKISKAIMNRTRLRNGFLRTRCNRDKEAYNMQRIYCVSLSGKLSKSTATILIIARLPNNK